MSTALWQAWTEAEVQQIRERAWQMEETGSIDAKFLKWIHDRKLFKLFVPEQLGGLMSSLPQAIEAFEEAAWIDGSFGWTVTIGAGGGFFVPFLQPQTTSKLFAPKEAVLAGSGMPTGNAKRVEGGFLVNGTWKYCSGSRHATFYTATAAVEAGDTGLQDQQLPDVISFALLANQVRIVPDWDAFGLRATDSHTITVKDAFVSDDRAFTFDRTYPDYEHPLYHYPFAAFAAVSFASVTLGIGRHFLDEAERMLEQNRFSWGRDKPERIAFIEYLINEGRCAYQEAKRNFNYHLEHSWDKLLQSGEVSLQEEQNCILQSKSAAQAMRAMAESLFPYLGMTAIMQQSPINQIWRDLHTACQHSALISFSKV